MASSSFSTAKGRLLRQLKLGGPQTAMELARHLRITAAAVRQHLQTLHEERCVSYQDRRGQVGRPRRIWQLKDSDAVRARFPDSHADLATDLLAAARVAFGDHGLDQLLRQRIDTQIADCQRRIPPAASLERRVKELAAVRRDGGYMPMWSQEADGSYLLIERHCPICAAATSCEGLCRAELLLFQAVLGDEALVEREEYMLGGHQRCAYRIRPL